MKTPARIIHLTERQVQKPSAVHKSVKTRVVIPAAEGVHVIPFKEIRHCTADGNYCYIHLFSGSEILASKTLKYISSLLPQSTFVRVHQSHLVNRHLVRFIGTDHVLLDDGTKLPVARSRRNEVLKAICPFLPEDDVVKADA